MSREPEDRPTEVMQAPTGVRLRTLILAVILSALVSIGASAAIATAVVEQGPPGPTGPEGPEGPEGPAGEAEVDPEAVWEAVEGDPDRVNQLIDPAPNDLADQVDSLSSDADSLRSDLDTTQQDLSQLCTDLTFSERRIERHHELPVEAPGWRGKGYGASHAERSTRCL